MPGDVVAVLGALSPVLLVLGITVRALGRSGVFRAVERLWREAATIKIVREQRRMATLTLPPDTELMHSLGGGPRLVIRRRRSGQDVRERNGEE